MRETKRHRRRNHELELECYVISMIAELRFLASGYRIAYSFVFLNIFLKFFQGLKIVLGIFIRGCEFKEDLHFFFLLNKRIYILATKLTTFLYIYFKGCVNYISRIVFIILKVLNKSSNSQWRRHIEVILGPP